MQVFSDALLFHAKNHYNDSYVTISEDYYLRNVNFLEL